LRVAAVQADERVGVVLAVVAKARTRGRRAC
jgi:hypothetical protein